MSKVSTISLKVFLDQHNNPKKLEWTAEDGNISSQETQASFLSFWDNANKTTFRIDLWTKKMSVKEMKQFFTENLLSITNSYVRATGDEKNKGFITEHIEEIYQQISQDNEPN